jgi:cation transport ATPase
VALEDEIREVSREAARRLQEAGVTVAMITGDARPVAGAVGRELGIDEVFAEVVLPMALGAVLMITSTVIVALNAQLLRRVRLVGLERPGGATTRGE